MFSQFLKTTQLLCNQKQPFAIAFVVHRKIPSSGKPGDKAVITPNGQLKGWLGGGCIKGIVLKEAFEAIQDGKPRLVKISQLNDDQRSGVKHYQVNSYQGGDIEIFVEPILPKPQLVIMGTSNVAMALSRLGKAMDYTVIAIARQTDRDGFPDADRIEEQAPEAGSLGGNNCVVVCTQGNQDEMALEQAIRSGANYIGFVSSPRRAKGVFSLLRRRGFSEDQLNRIKMPAGLDINAKLPEEVAVSILAEIVVYFRHPEQNHPPSNEKIGIDQFKSDLYINPVCNIPVQKSTAKHVLEHQGEKIYFCCDACKLSFEEEPMRYIADRIT